MCLASREQFASTVASQLRAALLMSSFESKFLAQIMPLFDAYLSLTTPPSRSHNSPHLLNCLRLILEELFFFQSL